MLFIPLWTHEYWIIWIFLHFCQKFLQKTTHWTLKDALYLKRCSLINQLTVWNSCVNKITTGFTPDKSSFHPPCLFSFVLSYCLNTNDTEFEYCVFRLSHTSGTWTSVKYWWVTSLSPSASESHHSKNKQIYFEVINFLVCLAVRTYNGKFVSKNTRLVDESFIYWNIQWDCFEDSLKMLFCWDWLST